MSLIFFAIASPCIAACIALVTKRRVVMEAATIIASVVVLVSVALLALIVAEDGTYSRSAYFSVDALGALVIATIASSVCRGVLFGCIRGKNGEKVIGSENAAVFYFLIHSSARCFLPPLPQTRS